MKLIRAYLLIIMALLVEMPVSAQIRGSHVNVCVVPDHQDWNYEVGQTAQFKVSVVRSSTLVDDVKLIFKVLQLNYRYKPYSLYHIYQKFST